MSREDFEIFDIRRQKKRERRDKRLRNASDFGWSKHTDTHWYRLLDGEKMHYWPSANKWLYKGVYYRGALPRKLVDMVVADNERLVSDA